MADDPWASFNPQADTSAPPMPIIPRTPAPQTPAQAAKDSADAQAAQFKASQEQLTLQHQQAQVRSFGDYIGKTMDAVSQARDLITQHPGMMSPVAFSIMKHIPGTPAAKLQALIDKDSGPLAANQVLQTVNQFRDEAGANPGGGGSPPRVFRSEIPLFAAAVGVTDPSDVGPAVVLHTLDNMEYYGKRAQASVNGANPDDPAVIKQFGIPKQPTLADAQNKLAGPSGDNTGGNGGTTPGAGGGTTGGGNSPPGGTPGGGLPSNLNPDQQAKDKEFLATNPTPAQYTSFLSTLLGRPVDAKAAEDRLKASNSGGSYSGGVVQGLVDNTKNDVAGLAQGAASLPDMLATGVGKVASAVPNAVGYGLDQLGYHNAADWIQQNITHPLANPPTIGGAIESVAPTPNTTFGRVNRAVGQFAGAAAAFPSSAAERAISNFVGEVPKPPIPPASPSTIINDGANNGIRVMTSDVAPPTTFLGKAAQAIGERIPITGTGAARAAQQQQRVAAIKSLAQDYGAASGDALTSPAVDSVAEGLAKQRGADLTRLTGQKDAVLSNVEGTVPTPNAVAAIDQQVARLSGINADAYAPVINKLQSFKDQLTSGKSLQEIEGNRKLLGSMFDDPNLANIRGDGEKAVSAIYGPLRDDMGNFIKANGSPGDFNRWQSANQGLASMAGDLQNAALRRSLNTADSTPENVASLLFSQKPSDVRLLYANLSPAGRAKAQSAILQKAIDGAGGMDNLSPDRFVNQVGSLGKSIGVFFQGDDLARIQGLSRVLDATRRAGQAAVAPPTGVQAVPYAMGAGFTEMFGIPGGLSAAAGTGLLARAYESAPVRSVLLKLGKSTPGSAEESSLLQRAGVAITSAVQKRVPNGALNDNLAQTGSVAASPNGGPNQQQ